MSRPNNYIESIANVPVHYDRYSDPRYGYGTRGKPNKFYVTEEFGTKLEACFSELWKVCPYEKAEVITSAGTYVNKPGYHGKGRAIDIDAIFWTDYTFITLNYPIQTKFYLGVEAILRKYFGTVLNYLYNDAHKDHFHIDDGTPVGFSRHSKSRVLFLQAALVHVFNHLISIDGIWGDETSGATQTILNYLEIEGDIGDRGVWPKLLTEISKSAFGFIEPEEKNPLELVRNVYNTINNELLNSASRKPIETALSTFLNHPDTLYFLKKYE